MALTEADIDEFIALIQKNADLRERVRRALIDGDLARITATLDQMAAEARAFRAELERFESETLARFDQVTAHADAQFDKVSGQFRAVDQRFAQVDERFDRVDQRFDGIDHRLDGVDQHLQGVDQRLDGIDHRLDSVDQHLQGVDQRLDGIDHRLDGVDQRLNRLEGKVGNLDGRQYEFNFRTNIGAHLGPRFRGARPISLADYAPLLNALDSGKLKDDEFQDALRLDLAILARDRAAPPAAEDALLALELSAVVDRGDVERARRRADILAGVGLPAVACVAGEAITRGAAEAARELDVAVLVDRPEPVD
jgi:archaellum component FlaC